MKIDNITISTMENVPKNTDTIAENAVSSNHHDEDPNSPKVNLVATKPFYVSMVINMKSMIIPKELGEKKKICLSQHHFINILYALFFICDICKYVMISY